MVLAREKVDTSVSLSAVGAYILHARVAHIPHAPIVVTVGGSDLSPRSPCKCGGGFLDCPVLFLAFSPAAFKRPGRSQREGLTPASVRSARHSPGSWTRRARRRGLFSASSPIETGDRICPRAAAYTSPFSHYVRAFVTCDAPPGRDRMSMFRLCTPARKLLPPT